MPDPLASCPVIKAGSYPVLQGKRDKWDEHRNNFLQIHASTLAPVYAEYVTNVPANYYSPCRQRCEDAETSGEGWLETWDDYFLGTNPAADNGVFGHTKRLIDELDCSKPYEEWSAHAANVNAALENLDERLNAAWYELIGLQSVFNLIFQDCPVPRPEGG